MDNLAFSPYLEYKLRIRIIFQQLKLPMHRNIGLS